MFSLPKFTFINGPAGSGKSTLATLLCNTDKSVYRESFANPIRDAILATFFPDEGPIYFSFDLREGAIKRKLFPYQDIFKVAQSGEKTFRDVMISFSEDWMKPQFGKDIFGRLALNRCAEQELFYDRFLFDDSGFPEEAAHIVKSVGAHNCLLIKLSRDGCNFSGDSRGYLDIFDVRTIEIANNGFPLEMLDTLALTFGAI